MKTRLLEKRAFNRHKQPGIIKPFSKSDLEFYLANSDPEKKIKILTLGKHTNATEILDI